MLQCGILIRTFGVYSFPKWGVLPRCLSLFGLKAWTEAAGATGSTKFLPHSAACPAKETGEQHRASKLIARLLPGSACIPFICDRGLFLYAKIHLHSPPLNSAFLNSEIMNPAAMISSVSHVSV